MGKTLQDYIASVDKSKIASMSRLGKPSEESFANRFGTMREFATAVDNVAGIEYFDNAEPIMLDGLADDAPRPGLSIEMALLNAKNTKGRFFVAPLAVE